MTLPRAAEPIPTRCGTPPRSVGPPGPARLGPAGKPLALLALVLASCVEVSAAPEVEQATPCGLDADCTDGQLCGTTGVCTGPTCEPAEVRTWFHDSDGDGFGDAEEARSACAPPSPTDWADRSGDCDDADPARWPGNQAEVACGEPRSSECLETLGACALPGHADLFVAPALTGKWNFGQGIEAGDLDGDGRPDLVLRSFAAEGSTATDTKRRLLLYFGPFPAEGGNRIDADASFVGASGSTLGDAFAILPGAPDEPASLLLGGKAKLSETATGREVPAFLCRGRDREDWRALAAAFPPTVAGALDRCVPVLSDDGVRGWAAGDLDPTDATSTHGFVLSVAHASRQVMELHLFDAPPTSAAELELDAEPPAEGRTVLRFAGEAPDERVFALTDVDGDGGADLLVAVTDATAGRYELLLLRGPFPAGGGGVLDGDALAVRVAGTSADNFGQFVAARAIPGAPAEVWVSADLARKDLEADVGRGRVDVLRWNGTALDNVGSVLGDARTVRFGYRLSVLGGRVDAAGRALPDELLIVGQTGGEASAVLVRDPFPAGGGELPLDDVAWATFAGVMEYGTLVSDLDGDGRRDLALSDYPHNQVALLLAAEGRF